jgi:histidinol-phosphatase (PHP family)
VPFTISSDAHLPEHVGYAYPQAVELMKGLGIDRIATFSGRERAMEPLG